MLAATWQVLIELAPWLLLGMVIAGVLHVMLPVNFVRRQLRGPWGVVKAVVLGVPLPLCSCGVIPAGLGLKKDGASDGASVGFLISTPQTGVDSILVSASFLGWPFAVFKVASAAVTGLVGGWIADAGSTGDAAAGTAAEEGALAKPRGLSEMISHAVDILRTIWRWVVFGIVVSAAITTFVPNDFFAGLSGAGALAPVLAALVISLPLYVCATASVPIAAALVASGMPAGAALVFLMAGPATNVATIGAVYRALGKRVLAVYLTTIIAGSVGAALVFDSLLPATVQPTTHIHGEPTWWAVTSAVLLLMMLAWFAVSDLLGWVSRFVAGRGPALEIGVSGMTCGGCASKLERALRAEEGVTGAAVTLTPGKAVVQGRIDEARLRRVIEQSGFSVSAP